MVHANRQRRTGTTELGGAAPVCPKKIFFLPKKFPDLGGQKPCLPEHFARKSFTYYIKFGSFARKKFFWGAEGQKNGQRELVKHLSTCESFYIIMK